jgi:hypothetical protein
MITKSKLLIDRDCPLCKAYGSLFKKAGLISDDVLTYYQEVSPNFVQDVDLERAKVEIALVDIANKRVDYGLDAFTRILFSESRFLMALLRVKPVRFALKSLYFFISLNRHVIVRPSLSCTENACSPPLHRGYRLAYSLFTAMVTALILSAYFSRIADQFSIANPWYMEYVICFGQIIWQGTFTLIKYRQQAWEYLGHMSTISLLGGLLLVPPLLLAQVFGFAPIYLVGTFLIVVVIMIQEHLLRCKRKGLGVEVTGSWIFYRLLILAFIAFKLYSK